MSEILISLLLLVGTVFALLGAIGLVRFPDFYNRTHATGKTTTLGIAGVVLAGTIYFSLQEGLTLKLLLVIPFLYWTSTAGGFMLRRAAHRTGTPLAPETVRDDLRHKAGVARERS